MLGPTNDSFGAGMYGGKSFVLDPRLDTPGWYSPNVVLAEPNDEEEAEMLELLTLHLEFTGSTVADAILSNWANSRSRFKTVLPVADLGSRTPIVTA